MDHKQTIWKMTKLLLNEGYSKEDSLAKINASKFAKDHQLQLSYDDITSHHSIDNLTKEFTGLSAYMCITK